jgi:hypothetical protein
MRVLEKPCQIPQAKARAVLATDLGDDRFDYRFLMKLGLAFAHDQIRQD